MSEGDEASSLLAKDARVLKKASSKSFRVKISWKASKEQGTKRNMLVIDGKEYSLTGVMGSISQTMPTNLHGLMPCRLWEDFVFDLSCVIETFPSLANDLECFSVCFLLPCVGWMRQRFFEREEKAAVDKVVRKHGPKFEQCSLYFSTPTKEVYFDEWWGQSVFKLYWLEVTWDPNLATDRI